MDKKNYSVVDGAFESLKGINRIVFGKDLGLTGCEVSLNSFPAGKGTPFSHSHKLNEEVYIIISGSGIFKIDDEEIKVKPGSVIRIAPAGKRFIEACDEELIYICIQAQENSLTQATESDGIIIK